MGTALIPCDRQCSAWSTLSGSAVTQIVITSSGKASNRDARVLYKALLSAVRRTGARLEIPKCVGRFGPGPEGCWAATHPGSVRRVLVWVADNALTPPPVRTTSFGKPSYQ